MSKELKSMTREEILKTRWKLTAPDKSTVEVNNLIEFIGANPDWNPDDSLEYLTTGKYYQGWKAVKIE